MLQPLILTLKIDAESHEFFNQLRQEHFPKERNFLEAHLTMFHHLPGEEISDICATLKAASADVSPFEIEFPKWRFLGRGVAIEVECSELLELRNSLAKVWKDHLRRQDSQKFKPHITVQNKVEAERARKLFEELSKNWQMLKGIGEGLQLWHYLGGPWKLEKEFCF